MAYMYVYELHVDLIHSRWARSASASHIHIARWANNKAVGRTNWQAGRQAFDDGDCLRFLETQTVMQNHFVLYFFRDGKLCCCLRDDGDCSKRAELGFSQGFFSCVVLNWKSCMLGCVFAGPLRGSSRSAIDWGWFTGQAAKARRMVNNMGNRIVFK